MSFLFFNRKLIYSVFFIFITLLALKKYIDINPLLFTKKEIKNSNFEKNNLNHNKNPKHEHKNNTVVSPFITLNNGVQMPRIGFGVYNIPRSITKKCVLDAISVGYRSIDTAQLYGNEKEVGEAVRASNVPRNELFITTKLWGCHGYFDAINSIETSLKHLDIEYIDLLLIHEPTGNFVEIYRALEDYYRRGKLKSIGISNFNEEEYLKLLNNSKIIPQVNQVETHVFMQQKTFKTFLENYGTQMEAWSPLASGDKKFFQNAVLGEIAKKHNKSIAQIGLRFLYQQNIIIIPKSTKIERMKENINILDFELTDDEMESIRKLDTGKSLFM
ncbi:NADP-dependent oxidoreductase domain-containing protein [Neocallimastix lanati (nom. inval.)]|nr:NADP-dependent oxidoreductase domain-containing protein [Neocallimastix sp. JGI-2020a]